MNPPAPLLSLSIVSHGQGALIASLLADLAGLQEPSFEVVVTLNLPEDEAPYQGHPFPVRILRNAAPKGFGANHNAAFAQCRGSFFAVVNPDIRLQARDLQPLLQCFDQARVAAVAPVVLSGQGRVEDSVRRFPTVARLARRVLLRRREPDYRWGEQPIVVDWTAGMFVLFRPDAFKEVGGFDDRRFFMYFEDVDICARLWRKGWRVLLQPQVRVVHDAQRASHRSMRHLRWHLTSALRYLSGI
ncbi:glycosyltransferase [Azohydromonas lata]|uniref:glycosyltransferase n=1 Tax=Azohydromonas lata TaxID=45677 RepID=UPI000A07227A|nr:glycosyltransferase [Azohydromonas lata]